MVIEYKTRQDCVENVIRRELRRKLKFDPKNK